MFLFWGLACCNAQLFSTTNLFLISQANPNPLQKIPHTLHLQLQDNVHTFRICSPLKDSLLSCLALEPPGSLSCCYEVHFLSSVGLLQAMSTITPHAPQNCELKLGARIQRTINLHLLCEPKGVLDLHFSTNIPLLSCFKANCFWNWGAFQKEVCDIGISCSPSKNQAGECKPLAWSQAVSWILAIKT